MYGQNHKLIYHFHKHNAYNFALLIIYININLAKI